MTLINDSARLNTGVLAHLGRKIKVARVAADLKQEDLGRIVGVSRSAVGLWEKGETEPSASKMFAIARATQQPLDFFAEGLDVHPLGLEPRTHCFRVDAAFWAIVDGLDVEVVR